jgi:iron complex transport system permease protein
MMRAEPRFMTAEAKTFWRFFAWAAAMLMIVSALALLGGAKFYTPSELFSSSDAATVVLALRLPRILMAVLVGGALAVVGTTYQSLFRNSLASPFSLGVSSGAALGASMALLVGISTTTCAILSALASIGLILAFSRRSIARTGDTILLIGIIFSFFCSSILTLVQYLSDYSQLFRMSRWMMGGIPVPEPSDLVLGSVLVAALYAWVVRNRDALDLMWFGDDVATLKGVNVDSVYQSAFLMTSLVIGWIVAQCGVVGFVGIIVPAGVRLLVGLRHRYVAPLSFLLGALLVVSCDLLGRVITPPFEVPVGVFTAVVGGPVFMALLLTGQRAR